MKGFEPVTSFTRRRTTCALSLWVLFSLLLLGLHIACTPEPEQTRVIPNQAPDTYISGAPLDSSNAFHRYHVYWSGFDPDGEVVEYGIAVTDSNIVPLLPDYRRTTRTDSIIEFVANNEVVLSHAVWVFAVDNEGERDPTPDRKYFNAVDVSRPVPFITGAEKTVNGETGALALNDTLPTAGSSVRIRWSATDDDLGGSITAYRIKLSTENAFTEIPADSTSASYSGLPSGAYEFLVEAVDNAGAESLDPARWSWIVNSEPDTRFTSMVVNGEQFDVNAGQGPWEPCEWPEAVPTIRDSSRVLFFFEGNDRDGEVVGFSYRIVRTDITRCSSRFGPYSVFQPEDFISLPVAPPSNPDTAAAFFTSNDYEVFVRSLDAEGKADGSPPSIKFRVNFTPRLRASALFPGQGAVVDSSQAVNDSLVVRFSADDVESPPAAMSYRVVLDGRYGLVVGPVNTEDELFYQFPFPEAGPHTLVYTVADPGLRTDEVTVEFTVAE